MSETGPPRVLQPWEFNPGDEEEYSTTLDGFFSSQRPLFSLSEKIWTPPTDIVESADRLTIKIEIAGVRDEDLDVAIDGNLLRVRGRRREELPPRKEGETRATYHLMEVRYGEFERVFGLPAKLDLDKVEATYRDGFLVIEIPRNHRAPSKIHVHGEGDA